MRSTSASSLIDRDRGLVWHPYTALNSGPAYAVVGAENTRLRLEAEDGTTFTAIDAMSSWWSMIHGYRNPVLDEALIRQSKTFSHVMFGGLTHEPAVELAEELVRVTPEPLRHVFFVDSGSVSVDVALKLASHYQAARGFPDRQLCVALRGAYHGDTVGAMSVCDPVDGMHSAFPGLVAKQIFLPRPPAASFMNGRFISDEESFTEWVAVMEEIIDTHSSLLCGIIVEPILQGYGGMYIYDPRCLTELRRMADKHDIVLIFDEIATGFGRTGTFFASEWAGVVPDVLCVGKALTGGYLTLAALLCTSHIAAVITQSPLGTILHGPTYMANPLACAVACASLRLLAHWNQQVSSISHALATALASANSLECVQDVRVLGAVGVVELVGPVNVAAVTRAALQRGVWLRPFRNLVYTMPPYICDETEIATIGAAITDAVAEVHGS